jgi:hypothetical protein
VRDSPGAGKLSERAGALLLAFARDEGVLAALWGIEKKLAARHLGEDCLILYDVSSSYYEGHTCPLARYGHDRDGKKGLPIIVYGVMTDGAGCPIAVQVYPGNTGDPTTVADQVEKLRDRFQLSRVVLVGDASRAEVEYARASCRQGPAARLPIQYGPAPGYQVGQAGRALVSYVGALLIASMDFEKGDKA